MTARKKLPVQIVAAELYLRRHPQHEKAVAVASFAAAGMYGAIAVKNMGLPNAKR